MTDANVRFYRPANGDVRTLHIETTGAVVKITVGLTDRHGRPTTRIDITPENESRDGDTHGRVWDLWQNGTLDCDGISAVVLRADPRHDDAAEARARAEQVRAGAPTDEYFSLVTTKPLGPGEREHIAMRIMGGSDEGPFVSGYDDPDDDAERPTFGPSTREGRSEVRGEVNLAFGDEDVLGTADRAVSGLVWALRVVHGPLPEGYHHRTLTDDEIAEARYSYPSARFLDMVFEGVCTVADLAFMARVMNRYAEMVARTVGE